MSPKVSIVYLSYNSVPYLPDVVDAWVKIDYPRESLEIVIVDNASADGSVAWIQEHVLPRSGAGLPSIIFFSQKENLGFAGGCNIGMEYAIANGASYVYLHNNDLKLDSASMKEAVSLAESDASIGSVQSLMCLWQDPLRVNSTGGMVHFLGFGFVRDNGRLLADCSVTDGGEIAYGSGAATLYRSSCLKEVGLLDSFLWLYHEDLELGWRLRLAGFKNVLSTKSIAYHKYEFRRSTSKIFWMERNRLLVHLSLLKPGTIILLAPFLLALEPALILFSIKGGWWKEKFRALAAFFSPKLWTYLYEKRKEARMLRRVSDREIVRMWTGKIVHQETSNPLVDRFANPVLGGVWEVLKNLIVW